MSVTQESDCIRLSGVARIEDAEVLVATLQAAPGLPVDWSGAGPLHTAVVQVLLILRPRLVGTPADTFNCTYLRPVLEAITARERS